MVQYPTRLSPSYSRGREPEISHEVTVPYVLQFISDSLSPISVTTEELVFSSYIIVIRIISMHRVADPDVIMRSKSSVVIFI